MRPARSEAYEEVSVKWEARRRRELPRAHEDKFAALFRPGLSFRTSAADYGKEDRLTNLPPRAVEAVSPNGGGNG